LKDEDDFLMTVQFVTKVSAMTWGRCIAQVIKEDDESKLRISIASRNANSTLDAGKNEKSMQRLIKDITDRLKAARGA
jgi:hypothetical protein